MATSKSKPRERAKIKVIRNPRARHSPAGPAIAAKTTGKLVPGPSGDYERSLKLSKKLPPPMRPTKDNPMLQTANNLTDLAEQIKICTRCDLAKSRTHAVPGEGPAGAEIMFIGEAPGFYEDQQGRPFVGPSGQFLNDLLGSIGLKREDVYIANVVKCRPPQNRDPQPDEMEACRVWLDKQLELIKPKVVVTISRYAMARWFPNKKISEIHGKAQRFGDLVVVAMYHPAAALHQHSLRQVLEEDFKKLPDYIKHPGKVPAGSGSGSQPPPAQLKMF
jgi:uracil-DNA glycosylase family 4